MVRRIPVTIRNKNPGAMYPGRASRKFGSRHTEQLGDGHKAATFATMIDGAAAMMYLLATSGHYKGKTIADAIYTWSGGNHVNAYLNRIEELTDHDRHTVIDNTLLTDSKELIALCKAMAWHETGREYPMSDREWNQAYKLYIDTVRGKAKPDSQPSQKPRTLALEVAWSARGQKEIPGEADNPFIVECFAAVGHPEIKDDETAWCAAFAGWALKKAGYAYLTDLTARSYLNYGEHLDAPEVGALVIMWRVSPNSWQGHVGFVESFDADTVTILGGNQSNAVTSMTVPRTGPKSQILGYRRPIPLHTPVTEIVNSNSVRYKMVGLFTMLWTLLATVWSWLLEPLGWAWDVLAAMLALLPGMSQTITSQIGAGQRITQSIDLPWPVTAGIAIVAVTMLLNLIDTVRRKRNRQDPETAPIRATGDGIEHFRISETDIGSVRAG